MTKIYKASVVSQSSIFVEAKSESEAIERAKKIWASNMCDYYFETEITDDWSVEEENPGIRDYYDYDDED